MDANAWDQRYRASELVWSAGPNQLVAELCQPLPPGRSIDLAAGEGRNALWLAEQGWDSTAVDYSEVAIAKARQIADHRALALTTDVVDLTEYIPQPGAYDLVLLAYLQLPDSQLTPILERAAAAVATGGSLIVISHDESNLDGGYGGPPDPAVLTTPAQVVAAIEPTLVVDSAEVVPRTVATEDGGRVALDTLVIARRPG